MKKRPFGGCSNVRKLTHAIAKKSACIYGKNRGNRRNRTMTKKIRWVPINCHKCGRFVGKNGKPDVIYDDYSGGWEIGYPLCEKCLKGETSHD